MPAAATATASVAPVPKPAKPQHVPDKKYKCQFCARAFSRSEHRSRHERSRKFLPTILFPFSPSMEGSLHGGVVKPTFCLLLLILHHRPQTPKSDPSNAQSAAVPLCDETFCYDMIGLYMPKMEECRWSAKSRDGRAQSQPPRRLLQSRPSTWIRRRWNK